MAGQPLPAVNANLHAKRKPRLQPDMHKAENRMDFVAVQMQTLTRSLNNLQSLLVSIAINVESRARLNAFKQADGTIGDCLLVRNSPGDFFLTGLRRTDVQNGAVNRCYRRHRR